MKAEAINLFIKQENYFYNHIFQIERLGLAKVDFSDLLGDLESLEGEDFVKDNLIIGIPGGVDLLLLISYLRKKFPLQTCKENFYELKNCRVNSKNYVIIFPKNFDSLATINNPDYIPMTFLERILLDTRIFLKFGSHLDAYLTKIPVCTGSVLWHSKPNRNRWPYMAWNVNAQKCFLEYTKEPQSVYMAEGRVKVIGM